MIQHKITIDLFLECVRRKVFTWDGVKEFAHNSRQFSSASDEEVYEVYSEIKKQYPHEAK